MSARLERLDYVNDGAPILPAHPFRGIVCGSSGSGKTHWVMSQWVLNPKTPFDRVIWCAPRLSLEQEKLRNAVAVLGGALVPIEGIDREAIQALIDQYYAAKEQTLVVLDDLIGSAKDPYISDLFTAGRHRNVSTIQILQQIFAPGTRCHRLNTDWYYVGHFGDQREMTMLANMLASSKADAAKIVAGYKQAMQTGGQYAYFLIDGQSRGRGSERRRALAFRSNRMDNVLPDLADV